MTTLIHIGLAILLFIIQNWIGAKAYAKGYIKFSLLDDNDEALSTNYVIKVFGPIVFLILTVAILQYLKLNCYIDGIIRVVYYYLGLRIVFIVLYERILIVNWLRISFYYFSIIIVSIIITEKFINSVDTLMPDFSTIKNEIWLLIIIFIYQVGNGFEEKMPNNALGETTLAYLPELKRRKKRYILRKHKEFSNQYLKKINEISNNDASFNLIIICILIFENFNRPRIIRFIESAWTKITGRKTTQGIMQKPSDKVLSDLRSVLIGTQQLFQNYTDFNKEEYSYYNFSRTIKRQCPDKKYVRQILFVAKAIIDDADNKDDYKKLFDEIKNEFQLYDYYS